VSALREELKAAVASRGEALRVSAGSQAESVVRIREALDAGEKRVQEMYHAFETLKYNEKQAAQAAREEAMNQARRVWGEQ